MSNGVQSATSGRAFLVPFVAFWRRLTDWGGIFFKNAQPFLLQMLELPPVYCPTQNTQNDEYQQDGNGQQKVETIHGQPSGH